MVLTTGVFNNMRSMVTGWYKEKVVIAIASSGPSDLIPDKAEEAGGIEIPPSAKADPAAKPIENTDDEKSES